MALRTKIEIVTAKTVDELAEKCQESIDNGRQLHGTPFWGVEKGTDGIFSQMMTVLTNAKREKE